MSFKKYRTIDLIIFAVILAVCESICVFASAKWFKGQLYTVSLSCTVIAIVMMRWGWMSAIHALLGGFVYVSAIFLCGVTSVMKFSYVIYCVGNLFSLVMLVAFKLIGKQKIRDSWWISVIYVIGIYVLMHLGHWIVSLCFGKSIKELINFLTFDVISLLFAIIAVLITRRLDGVFEDQKTYLFRFTRARDNITDNYNGREYVPKKNNSIDNKNEIK